MSYILDTRTGNWMPVSDDHFILDLPDGVTPDDDVEIADYGKSLIGMCERDR